MSQAGIVDFEGSHPQVPTSFVTDSGTAIPIGNVLEVLGTTVSAHGIPLETTGSGNTLTIVAQYASASGSSIASNAGYASFNSTFFTVDPNGYVSINGSGLGETITGNTGGALSPTAGNWNILTANSTPVFAGATSTLTLDFAINNLALGSNLPSRTTGNSNTAYGNAALNALTSASESVAVGFQSMQLANSSLTTAVGSQSLKNVTGTRNTATGYLSGQNLTTGTDNTFFGANTGTSYTGSESSNICIGSGTSGTVGESNAIRIGENNGTGFQLTGITNYFCHNFGTANLFTGLGAGNATLSTAANNCAFGRNGLSALTTGNQNAAFGQNTLQHATSGSFNSGFGFQSLLALTSGSDNTALGYETGLALTTGNQNTFVGDSAGIALVTGSNNTLIGYLAGTSYTGAEGNNILIGKSVTGTVGESNVTRIGAAQTSCFITGISGVTVVASAPVAVNSSGQLSSLGFGTSGQVLTSNGAGTSPTWQSNSSTDYHVARYIVSAGGAADGANYTTIASAYAAAVAAGAPQTVFIQPGIYTENITLTAGINICAFDCDAETPNVTILGKLTFTGAGTVSISGIRLKTNSDNFLAVTGSSASIVNIKNCFLECNNNTGITFSSSSSSSTINCYRCNGNVNTTGITYFTNTSSGVLNLLYCRLNNDGLSTTASTASAGTLQLRYTSIRVPITTSSTALLVSEWTKHDTDSINTTAITHGGNVISSVRFGYIISGTATAVSVSSTLFLESCGINTSNATTIAGAGTISYGLLYYGTTTTGAITTTTQVGGTARGNISQAPTAGYLGENINSYQATPQSVTTATGTNITSISCTPGVWNISGILNYVAAAITGTNFTVTVTTSSATQGTSGNDKFSTPTAPTASSGVSCVVPPLQFVFTATTTVYLVAYATYSAGSLTATGRITATRVG